MANGIEEIITELYEMIQDAWTVPLGADKCVIERDKVLDRLDEISNMLPPELKQAKTIVESRNEVITNAKREAETIQMQAEERAKKLVSEHEIYVQAQAEAKRMIEDAQQQNAELRRVTNEFVDDALRRTEESIRQTMAQITDIHAKYNALTGAEPKQESPIIEDV